MNVRHVNIRSVFSYACSTQRPWNCSFSINNSNSRLYHHRVCIIGTGPAGFYAAQHLVKIKPNTKVDLYEKLPVPFGLVRYGVAPDHPEVKNVINTFNNVLKHPNVTFVGNVETGRDISFAQLKDCYDAIVLCYGASEDRRLEIPGEKEHVTSAREFVGWYNGLPENRNLKIDLSTKRKAVIVGVGNVALDIARILLSPIHLLEKTDISPYALEALKKSSLEEVEICGRRGPLQVSFTIKELRELLNLEGVDHVFNIKDFDGINEEFIKGLPRPKKRLTELLWKSAQASKPTSTKNKRWIQTFFRSPVKIEKLSNSRLKFTLGVNKINPENSDQILDTGAVEENICDMVFRSVGYKGKRVFKELPFDEAKGIIPNVDGRVEKGVYCSGWVGQGPRGVILSTMQNAFDVAKIVAQDLEKEEPKKFEKGGYEGAKLCISQSKITGYKDYLKIADFEAKHGRKVTSVEEMMKIVGLS